MLLNTLFTVSTRVVDFSSFHSFFILICVYISLYFSHHFMMNKTFIFSGRHIGHVLHNVHVPGSGPIWLDEVLCPDSCRVRLDHCHHNGWGVHDCTHDQDVSIACYNRPVIAQPTSAVISPISTTVSKSQLISYLQMTTHFRIATCCINHTTI